MNFGDTLQWMMASCNTVRASRWTLLKARLFGCKVVGLDGSHQCTGYRYKDKLYITDFREMKNANK